MKYFYYEAKFKMKKKLVGGVGGVVGEGMG